MERIIFNAIISSTISLIITTLKHKFFMEPDIFLNYLFSKEIIINFFLYSLIGFIVLHYLFNRNIKVDKKSFTVVCIIFFLTILIIPFRYKIEYFNMLLNLIIFFEIIFLFRGEYKKIEENKALFIIIMMSFIITLLIFFRISSYHKAFHTNAMDFGFFLNTMWLIANNEPLKTWMVGGLQNTLLGDHFQPFLFILGFIYKLINKAEFYLLLQTIFICFASVFLFLISQIIINKTSFSLLLSLSYLISPLIFQAINFDFHLDPFYPFFIFGFVYFDLKKNFLLKIIFFLLAISLKEEISIYLFFSSIYMYYFNKDKSNIILSLLSIIYAIIIIFPVMHTTVDSSHADGSIRNILIGMKSGAFTAERLSNFILYLLGGVAYLALLNPIAFLLLAMPAIFIHYFHHANFNIQYAALVLPGLFLSIIFSIKNTKLKEISTKYEIAGIAILMASIAMHLYKNPIFNTKMMFLLILIIVIFSYVFNKKMDEKIFFLFLFVIVFFVDWQGYYKYNKYRAVTDFNRVNTIKEAIRLLPEDKNIPVFSNYYIVPHIADRKYVTSIEVDFIYRLMIPIIMTNARTFYLLHAFRADEIISKEREKIGNIMASSLIKETKFQGFKSKVIFNSNNVMLYKFFKIE